MDPKNYSVVEKLKDGREALIRAVRPSDKDKVRGILSVLSNETIYRRFFTLKKTLSEKEVSEFTDVDFLTTMQLVAELPEENNKIIAGCRYVVFDTNTVPERAEIAFMVLDDFQGKGLGNILLRNDAGFYRKWPESQPDDGWE